MSQTLQYGSLIAMIFGFVPVAICLNEWWVFVCTPIIGGFFLVQGIEYWLPEDPNLFRIAVAHVGCTTLVIINHIISSHSMNYRAILSLCAIIEL